MINTYAVLRTAPVVQGAAKAGLFLFCLLAVAFTTVPPASLAAAKKSDACADLLMERCTQCHYVTRVCQQLGKKSKWRWKKTLKNMVRHGAKLSKAEQKKLVNCLFRQSSAIIATCRPPAEKPGQ